MLSVLMKYLLTILHEFLCHLFQVADMVLKTVDGTADLVFLKGVTTTFTLKTTVKNKGPNDTTSVNGKSKLFNIILNTTL